MGDFIVSLEGTEAGERLALILVLCSALAHAIFGAINKGGVDPFLNRGAINICYSAIAAPFAFFVFPRPEGVLWWALLASYFIHIAYEYFQASAFQKGDFTVVYPIARGTGPLIAMILAIFVFHETFTAGQWIGGIGLSAAIIGLAVINIRRTRARGAALGGLHSAIVAAVVTGILLALYTLIDAYGIRLAADPFTFLAWFFFMGGFGFPLIAAARWRRLAVKPPIGDIALRGIVGAVVAIFSFGSIFLATRLDSVGEAAALRETSIIFGTAIGVLVFRETVDKTRLALIACIAAGAVLVEVG